ncbi:MAG: uncharacterized protein QOI98_2513 [Solirubrobacteraceae bacterium]|jgi:ketosteroid isomerase-like protein|nr:uncharacterized protein [Solirubrobacteraceae bacterium]
MSQENVEVVRTLYDEMAQGRLSTCMYLFDSEVEYARPSPAGEAAGLGGTWHGVEEMGRAVAEFIDAFDDFRLEAQRYIDVGDRVVVLGRFRCTAKTSGVLVERDVGDVLTVQDGRIMRFHQYWERAEALGAVGLRE